MSDFSMVIMTIIITIIITYWENNDENCPKHMHEDDFTESPH